MRVAILLMNSGRGSGEVARQHARQLIRHGQQVTFMHPRVGDGVPGATNVDVELHSTVIPVHEHLPSAGMDQAPVSDMTLEQASSYIDDYVTALEGVATDVDLLIGHHANLGAIATATVARRHALPYALFLHGTGIEPRHHGGYDDRIWSAIERAVVDADGLIVTTDYVRDRLVRNMIDLPTNRFLVLPVGIDLDEFTPSIHQQVLDLYGIPDRFVICPGALTASKGPQNVVAASNEYADLAPTVFIGDGEMRADLEAAIGDRGVFLGFVPADHKSALINSATVLAAAPEKLEHFGIIYAEALAAGTPPVAYDGGGVPSIVTESTGVLTERDPTSLGTAVRSLLESEDRRREMAIAARSRAEDEFDADVLGSHLVEWLETLMS
jgi:glycosyltransferase involved in cell wall biosynthesis